MDAIVKLSKKIANDSLQERQKTEPTHRYYTRPHRINVVQVIHNGKYLETSPRQVPPPELVSSGLPALRQFESIRAIEA